MNHIIDIIIAQPVKATASLFITLLILGLMGGGNKLTRFLLPPMAVTGLAFILAVIWTMP